MFVTALLFLAATLNQAFHVVRATLPRMSYERFGIPSYERFGIPSFERINYLAFILVLKFFRLLDLVAL